MTAIAEICNVLGQLVLGGHELDFARVRNCWSADAVMTIQQKDGQQSELSGRDAIVQSLEDARRREHGNIANFMAWPIVRVEGEKAFARSFVTRSNTGGQPQLCGFLEIWDELEREGDQCWRITKRTVAV